jgi:hypothetical protein
MTPLKRLGHEISRHLLCGAPLDLTFLQYPSPLCRLKWVVAHVIGMHIKLTILGEYDVASTTIVGILISNIVFTVDTRAH